MGEHERDHVAGAVRVLLEDGKEHEHHDALHDGEDERQGNLGNDVGGCEAHAGGSSEHEGGDGYEGEQSDGSSGEQVEAVAENASESGTAGQGIFVGAHEHDEGQCKGRRESGPGNPASDPEANGLEQEQAETQSKECGVSHRQGPAGGRGESGFAAGLVASASSGPMEVTIRTLSSLDMSTIGAASTDW